MEKCLCNGAWMRSCEVSGAVETARSTAPADPPPRVKIGQMPDCLRYGLVGYGYIDFQHQKGNSGLAQRSSTGM
jgi:hypothetical protein